MKHFSRTAVPVVLASLALVVIVVGVQATGILSWPADGIPVIKAAYDQVAPRVISDGVGGVIVVWEDKRGYGAGSGDIYAQRLNASGQVLWETTGVTVSAAAAQQRLPALTSDGEQGAIMAWQDRRNLLGYNDVYAQRILSDGTAAWISQGITISIVEGDQDYVCVAADGDGGAVLAWEDSRSGDRADIYAQRVSSDGSVQWAANGVQVGRAATNTESALPVIVPDGNGGALIAWKNTDENNHSDVWAQHVLSNGVAAWEEQGINVSAQGKADSPTMIPDGNGGAIVAWYGTLAGSNYGIFAQRLSANGSTSWGSGGITLEVGIAIDPHIVSDGAQGALIAWPAYPTLTPSNTVSIVRIQHVISNGAFAWTTPGITVSVSSAQQLIRLVDDGSAGAIIVGKAMTYTQGKYDSSLWGQRIDATGAKQWASEGISIAQHIGDFNQFVAASDMNHGAIVVWTDQRYTTDSDLYAQRISDFTATAWVYLPLVRR